MGIQSLAIVSPGCVTGASNKGRKREMGAMWVWVGAGWHGINESKEGNNRQQRTGEEEGDREGIRSLVLPSVPPSFSGFLLLDFPVPVAADGCIHMYSLPFRDRSKLLLIQ